MTSMITNHESKESSKRLCLNVREINDSQVKYRNSFNRDKEPLPGKFILVCVIGFATGVSGTIYFLRSMCCDMKMPGGWSMSMMWMRMAGETWLASALSFMLMWLAMMVPMMIPSALPMFLKTRRHWVSLCCMASGYFTIWLAAGVGIYTVGMAFTTVSMQSELFSRTIPLFSGAALITAGAIQFTHWKLDHLLRCRSLFGCAISSSQHNTSFRLGCKQGATCCLCCTAPMTVQVVLGIMNPLVMIAVAITIAAEKLLPRPEITARLVGIAAIVAGLVTIVTSFRWLNFGNII